GAVALSERISYLAREGVLSRLLKRWQMQLVVHPDPAFHSRAQRFGLELKRFESNDEGGNNVTCLRGKNRYCHYFINQLVCRANILADITDLLRFGQFVQT